MKFIIDESIKTLSLNIDNNIESKRNTKNITSDFIREFQIAVSENGLFSELTEFSKHLLARKLFRPSCSISVAYTFWLYSKEGVVFHMSIWECNIQFNTNGQRLDTLHIQ